MNMKRRATHVSCFEPHRDIFLILDAGTGYHCAFSTASYP